MWIGQLDDMVAENESFALFVQPKHFQPIRCDFSLRALLYVCVCFIPVASRIIHMKLWIIDKQMKRTLGEIPPHE